MADWKTYAKAARRTAERQGADARRSAAVYTQAARETARKQAPEAREALARSRAEGRRTAAAYSVIAQRRVARARLGQRLKNALRDALMIGGSILIIWFIVTRTGAPIPFTAVLAVIGVLMVIRFGYALLARTDTTVDEDNDLEGGFGERWPSEPDRRGAEGRDAADIGTTTREHDPRTQRTPEPRRR